MAEKKQGINKELIRELAALLRETELSEIEIEQSGFRVRVSRSVVAAPAAAAPEPWHSAPAPPAVSESSVSHGSLADPTRHPGCVPSPMVGTTYRSPEPGAAPYVEVGDTVAAGQTILIVE